MKCFPKYKISITLPRSMVSLQEYYA